MLDFFAYYCENCFDKTKRNEKEQESQGLFSYLQS